MNWHITVMDGVHQQLTEEEKEKRYQEIDHFIENRGDNKIFARKCFEFLNDCGLLTQGCISILEDKQKSRDAIGRACNSLGGVIRKAEDDRFDARGKERYWGTCYLYYNGTRYYVSSQWGTPAHREAFQRWIGRLAGIRL